MPAGSNPDSRVEVINDTSRRVPVDIGGATINATIDEVGVKDTGDVRIDPATRQLQEAVRDRLGLVAGATLASLLDTIRGHVDGLEANTTGLLTEATFAAEDFATQTTLAAVLAAVDGVEALLGTIDAELATQQKDALTDAELRASPVPVTGTVTADAGIPTISFTTGTKSSTGDTTLVAAPGPGSKLRLHLIHATPDSDNLLFPRIIFKGTGGGEVFRGGAVQHSRYPIDLPENEGLALNLDQAADVHWTVHHQTVAA